MHLFEIRAKALSLALKYSSPRTSRTDIEILANHYTSYIQLGRML